MPSPAVAATLSGRADFPHFLPIPIMQAIALFVAWVLLASSPALADTINVGGTGSATPLMQALGEAYRKRYPADDVRVMLPPPGSGGGARMLASGKLDLAVSGRPLGPEEQTRVGAVIPYARTPLVFAGRGARKAGFTRADIADLYAGRLSRWDDGSAVRLILRSPYESDSIQLRKLSPVVDAAVGAALERPGMAIAENDLEAVELLNKVPGSVGTTTLGLLKLTNHSLHIHALDGIVPSAQNLAESRYPLSKSIYLAAGRQPSESTLRFIEFLRTPQAREILRRTDYLSLP